MSRSYVSLGGRRTSSPHEFYRYPARFSPAFARAAIDAFTRPGDLIVDPFVGGGTTLVEAMNSGRRSIGSDLNTLATFITSVKTTPLSDADLLAVRGWCAALPVALSSEGSTSTPPHWEKHGYFKDLDDDLTGPVRNLIERALGSATEIPPGPAQRFARCVILRASQWGLDMRREVPSAHEFIAGLESQAASMLKVAVAFAESHHGTTPPLVLTQRLPGLSDRREVAEAPSLILTSPPYPGVYVLYHRWKLRGRREIPAPYWIADRPDGHGIARYTMSARSEPTQNAYFEQLEEAFLDLAKLSSDKTRLVQIVGFNGGLPQLDRYLKAMTSAGFAEEQFPELATDEDGRLWRDVPNRRWWTEATSRKSVAVHTAREVVLIHRPAT